MATPTFKGVFGEDRCQGTQHSGDRGAAAARRTTIQGRSSAATRRCPPGGRGPGGTKSPDHGLHGGRGPAEDERSDRLRARVIAQHASRHRPLLRGSHATGEGGPGEAPPHPRGQGGLTGDAQFCLASTVDPADLAGPSGPPTAARRRTLRRAARPQRLVLTDGALLRCRTAAQGSSHRGSARSALVV